jgi:Kazal-type serine protease inhibitor domain
MTRLSLSGLLVATSLAALACDGREIAVFDVPAVGGTAGGGGAAGSVSDSGNTAAEMKVPSAGTSGGGASAGDAMLGGAGGGSGSASAGGTAGSGGLQGTAGTPPTPCMSDADCSGWRCEKQSCDAPSGFCEPSPVFCPPDPSPVCGCDGVTYWNDCIRRQSGAQMSAPGQCLVTACACEVGSDCKVPNASCSHLVAPGEMCGHGMGACWVLPPQCTPNVDSQMWQECKPPDAPPSPCVDTCTAILSEKSYAPPHRGMTCN